MKNLRILPPLVIVLTLVLLLPTQMGCELIDKIKGLETFDVDFDACRDIPVEITAEDPDFVVGEPFTISAADNPDLVEYLSDIESWDILVAYIQVWQFSGDEETSFSGTVKIGNYSETFTDIKPFEWADGRTVYLTLDEATLKDLNEDMKADNKIEGSVTGEVSHKPVFFIIHLCVEAVAEVKA